MNKPIYVTQPALPPLDEFLQSLHQIWDNKILTNNGPFHQQFEKALAEYLGVKYISLFTNGTLALVTALQALNITGEVITSPFSFVATTHALWWNNIKPVFVDIESEHFNLDPNKIEAAISPSTTAILPIHVYGNPCDVEAIQKIADTYGLKVLYDAAHAFGVNKKGESILNFGNLSILSFHATKVFNTFEGGAIISQDQTMKHRIDYLKNFGYADELTVVAPGINAKMNELQASFGLLQLRYVDEYIAKRKAIAKLYQQELRGIQGLWFPSEMEDVSHCYSYFPVFVTTEEYGHSRNQIYDHLKSYNIFCRRYFYPLISQFPTYRGLLSSDPKNLPTATVLADKVLCLPIYPSLEFQDVHKIIRIIKDFSR